MQTLTVSVPPAPSPCAIACIYICAHVKDPIVHVRIPWIMEALKHPPRPKSWVVRLCRSWLSPEGRQPEFSMEEIPLGQYSCKKCKKKTKTNPTPKSPRNHLPGSCLSLCLSGSRSTSPATQQSYSPTGNKQQNTHTHTHTHTHKQRKHTHSTRVITKIAAGFQREPAYYV